MSNLVRALRPLAWDFLSTLVFATLVALHVDARAATALAIGTGLVQLAAVRLRGGRIELLQWAGLGLTLVFGGLSLATHDPRFIMAKPSLIYLAIAAVMLKRGWMLRYIPAIAQGHAEDLAVGWGYAWSALMGATAAANLIVAVWFAPQWPAFMAIAPAASKLALFLVQYVSMRIVIRGRINAAQAAGLQAAELQAA
ncbi:inner membrane-spanning protein YciB [Phenylobacterium soli]|uniref:Intracellular septation protein n=1 Tax=Phenylobacterium soli TaxID=2170551 RepID=A0A328AI65_9CAUL|nr:septation protein IspZ [Phenylobacterium soli]RAK54613.1 intracellular septation protein [Phenylobacterium soli]